MLISVSGSGGCGKSTILGKLKQQGFNVVERKTSRSILNEWGITLEEVNVNPATALRFQDEILSRKYEDEYELSQSSDIWFTERTFADLCTYFLVSFGKLNDFNAAINEYYKRCIKHQQLYDKVFYLKSGHFSPERDGVRGSNIHYSRMIDLVMFDLTNQMTPSNRLTIIDTPCLEQRLELIIAHCGLT